MSYPHSRTQIGKLNEIENDDPFIWMFELTVTTQSVVRLVRNPVPLTFGQDGSGQPLTYYPMNFSVGSYGQDTDGSVRAISISVSNVSREVMAIMEHHDLIGLPATILCVNAAQLDSVTPYWRVDGDVVSAQVTEEAASLQIGQTVLQSRNFPARRITRARYPGVPRRVGLGT